jgi:hypothetical protein
MMDALWLRLKIAMHYLYVKSIFLEKLIDFQLAQKFPVFIEWKVHHCSGKPVIGPNPEPVHYLKLTPWSSPS